MKRVLQNLLQFDQRGRSEADRRGSDRESPRIEAVTRDMTLFTSVIITAFERPTPP